MQMSHCDDEDESASRGARHKGAFGPLGSWWVGVFQREGPAGASV